MSLYPISFPFPQPVELLYRSEQEVLSSLPAGVPPSTLQAVHRRAEEERQGG